MYRLLKVSRKEEATGVVRLHYLTERVTSEMSREDNVLFFLTLYKTFEILIQS